MTLLTANDVCFKIITFHCHADEIPKHEPLFSKLEFPVVSRTAIQDVFTEMQTPIDCQMLLRQYGYSLEFSTEMIDRVLELMRAKDKVNFCTAVLLHVALEIFLYPNTVKDQVTLEKLLSGILDAVEMDCYDLPDVVLSSFYHFYSCFINMPIVVNYDRFVQLMIEFLTITKINMPHEIDELINKTGVVIFKNGEDTGPAAGVFLGGFDAIQSIRPIRKYCYSQITSWIRSPLLSLDDDILQFLVKCGKWLDKSVMMEIIALLPLAILGKVQMFDMGIDFSADKQLISFTIGHEIDNMVFPNIPERETMIGRAPCTFKTLKFPNFKPIEDFIHHDLILPVKRIVDLLAIDSGLYLVFVKECKTMLLCKDDKNSYIIMAMFAYICEQMLAKIGRIDQPNLVEAMFTSVVFSEESSFLNENINLMSLRAKFVEIVAKYTYNAGDMASALRFKPLLLAEVLFMLTRHAKSVQFEDGRLMSLLSSLFYLMNPAKVDESKKMIMGHLRFAILAVIEALCENDRMRNIIFKQDDFVLAICHLLMIDDYRSCAMRILTEYGAKENVMSNMLFKSSINSVMAVMSASAKTEDPMLVDLLKMATEFGPVLFPKCSPDICSIMYGIRNPCEVIYAVSDYIERGNPSMADIQQFANTVARVYQGDPPMRIFATLMNLLAGKKLTTVSPDFVIQKGELLMVVVTFFMSTKMYRGFIEFLAQLCEFSLENREVCHRYSIDMFILEQLPSQTNPALVDSFLRLYSVICSYASSIQSVTKFIDMLSLPDYSMKMLHTLNSMLTNVDNLPEASFRVNDSAVIKSAGLPGSWAKNNFTLLFWIHITRQNSSAQLFEFTDGKENIIIIKIQNGKLGVHMSSETSEMECVSQTEIPTNKWIDMTVSVFLEGGRWHMTVTLGGEQITNLMAIAPEFDTEMTLFIGSKQNGANNGTSLGPFAFMSRLDSTRIRYIHKRGIRGNISDMTPYFYVVPQQKGKIITLHCPQNLQMEYTFVQSAATETFGDILSVKTDIKKLIPVINVADEASLDTTFYSIFFEIIHRALLFNRAAQRIFSKTGCFQMLANTLASTKRLKLDRYAYATCSSLLEVVIDDNFLVMLLKYILMNIRIWIRGDFETAQYALKCMTELVASNVMQHVSSVFPFDRIMALQRSIFYYEPLETDIIETDRGNFTHDEIRVLRRHLWRLAAFVGKLEFQQDTLNCVMGHILTCPDDQVVDILEFCTKFFGNWSVDHLHTDITMFHLAIYAIPKGSVDVCIAVLRFLDEMYKYRVGTPYQFTDIVDIIINQFPQELITPDLFEKVVGLCNEGVQASMMLPWIAFHLGPEYVQRVIKEMQLCNTDFSLMYAMAGLAKLKGNQRIECISLLLNQLPENRWMELIVLCDIVEVTGAEMMASVKADIIAVAREMCHDISLLYSMILHGVCLMLGSERVTHTIDDGSIGPNVYLHTVVQETYKSLLLQDEYERTAATRFVLRKGHMFHYGLGLRRGEYGEWADFDLASNIVNFIEDKSGYQPVVDYFNAIMDRGSTIAAEEKAVLDQIDLKLHKAVISRIAKQQRDNSDFCVKLKSYCEGRMTSEVNKIKHAYQNYLQTMILKEHGNVIMCDPSTWKESTGYEVDRTLCGPCYIPVKCRPTQTCQCIESTEVHKEGSHTCEIVEGKATTKGNFICEGRNIIITTEKKQHNLLGSHIDVIMIRTRYHRRNSIEIFMKDRQSIFVTFPGRDSAVLMQEYSGLPIKWTTDIKNSRGLWKSRDISNFEYIMRLNTEAGRSFNDFDQYPIVPCVLARVDKYDAEDASCFRDLSRAMSDSKRSKSSSKQTKKTDKSPVSRHDVCSYLGRMLPPEQISDPILGQMSDVIEPARNAELIPEFYASFEFMRSRNEEKGMILPFFSATDYDFIYTHRKALESEYVSTHLNQWIDAIFGLKQKSASTQRELYPGYFDQAGARSDAEIRQIIQEKGQFPRQLYTKAQDKRGSAKHRPLKQICTIQMDISRRAQLKAATFGIVSKSQISIVGIETGGVMRLGSFEIGATKPWKEPVQPRGPYDIIEFRKIIPRKDGSFLVACRDSREVFKMKSSVEDYITTRSYVKTLSCDGELIAAADVDDVLSVFENQVMKFGVKSVNGKITATAISEPFQCAVACTDTNYMIICSVNNAEVVRVVQTGANIKFVEISPSWGFIIACYAYDDKLDSIALFSVNGDLIREILFNSRIEFMTVFESSSGFDYVIIGDASKTIWLGEAFYLNFRNKGSFGSVVVNAMYNSYNECIVAVCADGSINFIPERL